MSIFTGVDLGGTFIKFVVLDEEGKILDQSTEETRDREPGKATWSEAIIQKIKYIEETFGFPPKKAGLSAPGLASPDHKTIYHMPGRLEGLENLDWQKLIGQETEVSVLNDAHAALYGEFQLGTAKGVSNVLMLTLGTGVGGAAMVNNQLLTGAIGRAGHLGHISLNLYEKPDDTHVPGSLEYYVGELFLPTRSEGKYSTTSGLLVDYQKGNQLAIRLWEETTLALACGISSLINCFDPELIVIGGGITQAGALLWEPLERNLAKVEWRPKNYQVPVKPAALGSHAGAVGAALFAKNH